MQLHKHGTSILAMRPNRLPILVEKIDPRRALACLIASGYRLVVAREVAHGPLSNEAAIRLAKEVRLLQ